VVLLRRNGGQEGGLSALLPGDGKFPAEKHGASADDPLVPPVQGGRRGEKAHVIRSPVIAHHSGAPDGFSTVAFSSVHIRRTKGIEIGTGFHRLPRKVELESVNEIDGGAQLVAHLGGYAVSGLIVFVKVNGSAVHVSAVGQRPDAEKFLLVSGASDAINGLVHRDTCFLLLVRCIISVFDPLRQEGEGKTGKGE
jgi:hypothetical protein